MCDRTGDSAGTHCSRGCEKSRKLSTRTSTLRTKEVEPCNSVHVINPKPEADNESFLFDFALFLRATSKFVSGLIRRWWRFCFTSCQFTHCSFHRSNLFCETCNFLIVLLLQGLYFSCVRFWCPLFVSSSSLWACIINLLLLLIGECTPRCARGILSCKNGAVG